MSASKIKPASYGASAAKSVNHDHESSGKAAVQAVATIKKSRARKTRKKKAPILEGVKFSAKASPTGSMHPSKPSTWLCSAQNAISKTPRRRHVVQQNITSGAGQASEAAEQPAILAAKEGLSTAICREPGLSQQSRHSAPLHAQREKSFVSPSSLGKLPVQSAEFEATSNAKADIRASSSRVAKPLAMDVIARTPDVVKRTDTTSSALAADSTKKAQVLAQGAGRDDTASTEGLKASAQVAVSFATKVNPSAVNLGLDKHAVGLHPAEEGKAESWDLPETDLSDCGPLLPAVEFAMDHGYFPAGTAQPIVPEGSVSKGYQTSRQPSATAKRAVESGRSSEKHTYRKLGTPNEAGHLVGADIAVVRGACKTPFSCPPIRSLAQLPHCGATATQFKGFQAQQQQQQRCCPGVFFGRGHHLSAAAAKDKSCHRHALHSQADFTKKQNDSRTVKAIGSTAHINVAAQELNCTLVSRSSGSVEFYTAMETLPHYSCKSASLKSEAGTGCPISKIPHIEAAPFGVGCTAAQNAVVHKSDYKVKDLQHTSHNEVPDESLTLRGWQHCSVVPTTSAADQDRQTSKFTEKNLTPNRMKPPVGEQKRGVRCAVNSSAMVGLQLPQQANAAGRSEPEDDDLVTPEKGQETGSKRHCLNAQYSSKPSRTSIEPNPDCIPHRAACAVPGVGPEAKAGSTRPNVDPGQTAQRRRLLRDASSGLQNPARAAPLRVIIKRGMQDHNQGPVSKQLKDRLSNSFPPRNLAVFSSVHLQPQETIVPRHGGENLLNGFGILHTANSVGAGPHGQHWSASQAAPMYRRSNSPAQSAWPAAINSHALQAGGSVWLDARQLLNPFL